MISQTAEYALRAIVFLADQGGKPRTTAQIAEVTQVPAGYLAKVMQSLSRTRLVNSQRGLNGGFTLAKDPNDLTVAEIINAVDPIRRFHECPLDVPTHDDDLCPLHQLLEDAASALDKMFSEKSVAQLLDVPGPNKPLCRFPAVEKTVVPPPSVAEAAPQAEAAAKPPQPVDDGSKPSADTPAE